MNNEDYLAKVHADYSKMSGIEKTMFDYEQSKERVHYRKAERLNDSVPLATLYKSLVKHYAQQNRYIDRLEKENNGLKKEVIDKMWLIQSLKEKFEHTEIGELYAKLEESEKRRKNITKMFEGFIAKHKAKDVCEADIEVLMVQIKESLENPE